MPKYGFRKRVGRVVRRVVRKGVKYAKKRYVSKKGNLRLGKLSKDVMMLKNLINVEKKRYADAFNGVVGQVNGAGGGAAMFDITPTIVQGLAVNQRSGNSVKLTGAYLQFQFTQQSNSIDSNAFSVEIWSHKAKEVTMSLSSTGQEIYNASPFSLQMDLLSRRNQDYFGDYYCIRRKTVRFPADNFSVNQVKNLQFNLGLKLNRHLRWDNSGLLINGQLFVIIRAKNGNCSTATVSTATIPYTNVNTGATFQVASCMYYVDN